jgi:GPI mannosyltransferase 3
MYGFWVFPVLGNIHFNVIQGEAGDSSTAQCFLTHDIGTYHNIITSLSTAVGNGSLYGSHPFYWYYLAGIPAITGMLLPILLYDLFLAQNWNYSRRNLWIMIGSCVFAHSGSAHKEFRFLLPILPLFCLLAGSRLDDLSRKSRTRRRDIIFMTIGATINFGALLYLGLIHQRAPIDVNQAIVNQIAAAVLDNAISPQQSIQIHYLMGCHSTPLMSHLHAPPTQFETWFLDCSPSCRANPAVDCESVAFMKSPRNFLEQAYFPCSPLEEDETCTTNKELVTARAFPDFLVCNAENLSEMKKTLETTMNMKEIGRFIQGINGVQLGNHMIFGADNISNNGFSRLDLFRGFVGVSLDEIVLFRRAFPGKFSDHG